MICPFDLYCSYIEITSSNPTQCVVCSRFSVLSHDSPTPCLKNPAPYMNKNSESLVFLSAGYKIVLFVRWLNIPTQ
jgi:hypothetical protein